jgi:hypothetical protein
MGKKIQTEAEKETLSQPFDFDTWEFNTMEDYDVWNMHAHKAFREAKKHNPKCDPPIPVRVPDESFHKKARVKFQRFDQPENVLKVHVRNKYIDWKGQLKPGCTYDLPIPVIKFLNGLAVPIFAEVKVEDGGETRTETKQVGERNRFSCHLLEFAA